MYIKKKKKVRKLDGSQMTKGQTIYFKVLLKWLFSVELLEKLHTWIGVFLFYHDEDGICGEHRIWIRFCITTVRFSILVNGSPYGFLGSPRGLRQGGPLSSMLFILVMEELSKMTDRAVTWGFLMGFTALIGQQSNVKVTHLLFANDTHKSQLTYLREVLNWFQFVPC